MKLSEFDFELPAERIAMRPVRPRHAARLLEVRGDGGLADRRVSDLASLLAPGDLLVVNDTKVLPTRLAGRRGEAGISVTLYQQDSADAWWAFARPARKLRPGDRIDFGPDFSATVDEKGARGRTLLRFDRAGPDLMAALNAQGAMPLPPYIKRPGGMADEQDQRDYQTIFAARPGAVAAPTAGLHFTEALLGELDARGIGRVAVTLHVGAGTFLPIVGETVEDHAMHAEAGEIGADAAAAINAARGRDGRIVAVGSTALRLLETAAAADGTVQPFAGETDIYITPGHRFRAADLMLTNFHLPRSTLFVLVCAFAGTGRMQAAYAHAISQGYRFYSYGDACLLHPEDGR